MGDQTLAGKRGGAAIAGSQAPYSCYWSVAQSFGSGINTYCQALAASLSNLGLHPTILDLSSYRPSVLLRSKVLAPILKANQLRQLAYKQQQNSLMIYHGLSNIDVPVLDILGPKVKYVVTLHDLIPILPHNGVSFSYEQEFRFALRRVLTRCDKIICVSKWTKNQLLERFPAVEPKAVVIPNGVDRFLPAKGAIVNVKRQEPRYRLLCVARDEPYKRLDLLLGIIANLGAAYSLTLVTNSGGLRRLSRLGQDLIAKGCLFVKTGLTQDQMHQEYSDADLYLQPSLYEGFCLPVAEAIGHRLGVVYTLGSAVTELVAPQLGKGLPSASSVEDWVEVIKEWRSKMGTHRLDKDFEDFFAKHYSWDDTAEAVRGVYNSLV